MAIPPNPTPSLTVAVAQCNATPGEVQANLETIQLCAEEAARGGADLVVMPEMMTTGYGLSEQTLHQISEPVEGPTVQAVAEICATTGIAICLGHPDQVGENIYNAFSLIDEHGQRLLTGHKAHLFGDLDHQLYQEAEQFPTTVNWHGWQIGGAICYDIEFPETARHLALHGAELICVPTANMVGFDAVSNVILPARGLENQLYVAYANFCGNDEIYQYNGFSIVVGPDGETMTRAGRDRQLLITELTKQKLNTARKENSYLSDRRADLYTAQPNGE